MLDAAAAGAGLTAAAAARAYDLVPRILAAARDTGGRPPAAAVLAAALQAAEDGHAATAFSVLQVKVGVQIATFAAIPRTWLLDVWIVAGALP